MLRRHPRRCVSRPPICAMSGGHLGLAGTSPGPFTRHDRAVQEKFPAPDAPRLLALERAQKGRPAAPRSRGRAPWRSRRLPVIGEKQIRVVGAGQGHRCLSRLSTGTESPPDPAKPASNPSASAALAVALGHCIGANPSRLLIPRRHAISRPSEGTEAQILRPRTLCGVRGLEGFWPALLGRFPQGLRTRSALAIGVNAGHVRVLVADIRVPRLRHGGKRHERAANRRPERPPRRGRLRARGDGEQEAGRQTPPAPSGRRSAVKCRHGRAARQPERRSSMLSLGTSLRGDRRRSQTHGSSLRSATRDGQHIF